MANPVTPNQPASTGLVVAGYIFAVLGGLIGLVIGILLKWGKVPDASGAKVPRYDEAGQKQGLIIFIIALVSIIFWNVVRMSIR